MSSELIQLREEIEIGVKTNYYYVMEATGRIIVPDTDDDAAKGAVNLLKDHPIRNGILNKCSEEPTKSHLSPGVSIEDLVQVPTPSAPTPLETIIPDSILPDEPETVDNSDRNTDPPPAEVNKAEDESSMFIGGLPWTPTVPVDNDPDSSNNGGLPSFNFKGIPEEVALTLLRPKLVPRARANQPKTKHVRVPAQKKLSCPHEGCGNVYTTKASLQTHVRVAHQGERHECPRCHKQFKYDSSLSRHTLLNVCENTEGEPPPQEEERNHICPICSKGFATATYLQNHHNGSHRHRFTCEFCARTFTRRDHYDYHLQRIHSKATGRPQVFYNCTEPGCGKLLKTNLGLRMHMVKEHGILKPRS